MKRVLIFSAPSGSGKTTIVQQLLSENQSLNFSVSATTRPKRPHEIHGKDYYFLNLEEFQAKLEAGDFIETEEVYKGTLYGTLKSEIEHIHQQGNTVVFDVDVVGGINLKKYFGDEALAIFVRVPSLEMLEKRLRKRGTESEESLQKRLAKAEQEWTYEALFDVSVINDKLEETVSQVKRILHQTK